MRYLLFDGIPYLCNNFVAALREDLFCGSFTNSACVLQWYLFCDGEQLLAVQAAKLSAEVYGFIAYSSISADGSSTTAHERAQKIPFYTGAECRRQVIQRR